MEVKSLLMVMATLTIAGCSQNEMTEMNPDTNRTIGLDVYTEVQTRGTETTTSTLKANAGFGILHSLFNKLFSLLKIRFHIIGNAFCFFYILHLSK